MDYYPTRDERRKKRAVSQKVVWGLLAVFLLAALIMAYLTYKVVRGITTSLWSPTSPQVNISEKSSTNNLPAIDQKDLKKPLQSKGGPSPENLVQSKRVNILVMGLDYRDWEAGNGASRTDTMLLFTIDPTSRSVGMLSIPRDLWVKIPGYEYGKINTAYFLGEAYKVDGGGPGLAMRTVEQLLDIQIQFYAQIDFVAFEKFIDELGGIDVEVTNEISVDPLGPHNTVVLKPGVEHLDGPIALAYARCRDSAGSDFDRAQRQQQVILAIRARIMDLNLLPKLIEKSPILYQQLKDGVHTNLTLEQVISLAWLAQQIPPDNITRAAIGPDQVFNDVSADGQYILVPKSDEIRKLRDEVFSTSNHAKPVPQVIGDLTQLMSAENSRISVLNGTSEPGLASKTTKFLQSKGLNVTLTDNAQEIYQYTTIIDYTGKIYTRQFIAQLMGVQPSQIFSRYDPNSPVDIAILLGNDWATSNTIP